jgi:cytochrome b6-f complex iron-sulfur subunit
MNRREFCGWVSLGVLASSLPVALAACNSDTEETQAEGESPAAPEESPVADSAVREDGYQAIGTVQELEAEGTIIDRDIAADPVLVVRNPESNNPIAVDPTCTHQACTVEWDAEAQIFACPCHGSKFEMDGSVAEGPAPQPLASYEVKEEDGSILVKVG